MNMHATLMAVTLRAVRSLLSREDDLKLEMPLDKDAEFEKARDALLAGNFTSFEAIRNEVPRPLLPRQSPAAMH